MGEASWFPVVKEPPKFKDAAVVVLPRALARPLLAGRI